MSTFRDRFEGVWTPLFIQKLLFKVAMVLLIVGGLNWLSVAIFDCNLVSAVFGDGVISKVIYILVGLSALGVMLDRDTYLPFLGPMVAPCTVLENREPPGATKEIKVIVENAHTKALAILHANRDLLESISEKLLETEVIEGEFLTNLLAQVKPAEVNV